MTELKYLSRIYSHRNFRSRKKKAQILRALAWKIARQVFTRALKRLYRAARHNILVGACSQGTRVRGVA